MGEPSAPSGRAAAGRPRDAEVDTRLFAAAEAILCEGGLAALSMEAVARRAGVGKQTLYRRYRTRLPLLVDLMRKVSEERAPARPPADAPPPDVRRIVEAAYRFASSPVGGAVMRALLAEAAADEAAMALVRERFVEARRALLIDAIMREAGVRRREAVVRTDMAFGLMWYRLAMGTAPPDEAIDEVVVFLTAPTAGG